MGYKFTMTKEAYKDIDALDRIVAQRIIKKLKWFENQENPLRQAVLLRDSIIGDIRFRIGDYRAIALIDEKHLAIIIVRIGHRREIYRQ